MSRVGRLVTLTEGGARRVLVVASVVCLVALALMTWSLFSPTVLAVMVAMSVGQGLGTLSLALFVWVVIADLWRARVIGEERRE